MEQNYSNKIVSLHLKPCKYGCPNKEVCYLRKRNPAQGNPLPITFKEDMLLQGFTIHDALCDTPTSYNFFLLQRFKNYNITVSIEDLYSDTVKELQKFKNQVQVSVYDIKDVKAYSGQKLFLIHDQQTLVRAKFLFKQDWVRNIHFNVDPTGFNSSLVFLQDGDRNITMDTCLSSWVVNGECPYTTNYIDISYDWTIRKCPFAKDSIPIPKNMITNSNYIDLFTLEPTPNECSYAEKFKRNDDGQ